MLEIKNISKSFSIRGFSKSCQTIFETININFEKGKIYLISGANGSGKTTLLKIIAGWIIPDSGDIYFNGLKLSYKNYKFNFFSLLPETPYFYQQISALENIRFFLKLREKELNIQKAEKYLGILRLGSFELKKRFSSLSNGNKIKTMLLKSLIENPPVLLIDEGLKSLDIESFNSLKKFLKEEFVKEKIIAIATNDAQSLCDISDEILIIKDRKISKISHKDYV